MCDVEECKSDFWRSSDNIIEASHVFNYQNVRNYISAQSNECCLVLTVPPENRFRYRYDTEMSGTHGSLQGIKTGKEKSYPTVTLLNYPHEALIRVTLVTCQKNEEPYPHPHSLFVREKLYQKEIYENVEGKKPTKSGHFSGPHYVRVGRKKNYTARFEGMCIINSKKENFHSSVRDKMLKKLKEEGKDRITVMGENDITDELIEKAVSCVDVDFVRLCFEGFREESGDLFPICSPIYSEPIGNAKSAKTGQLKISRINKCSGSCRGGDEIWMLVEKINKKGLVVKFWEECNGKTIWESCLEGDDLILHHQYAIIFKTPAYRDVNLLSETEIFMRLERMTEPNQVCDYSDPITFVYEPSRRKSSKGDSLHRKESILTPLDQIHIKRPRTDCTSPVLYHHDGNRNYDDFEFGNMTFEDSTESYIEQILFGGKDSIEFDQAWANFNVEEFLQFLSSDDVDMPLQRDGVFLSGKQYRDLLYKLYRLYSKVEESDIRKLTDDVSNFRVSKKGSETHRRNRSFVEKDQVKDAASTLLSLRSKAMAINNVSPDTKRNEKIFSDEVNSIISHHSSNDNNHRVCELNSDVLQPIRTSVIKNNTTSSLFNGRKTQTERDATNRNEGKNFSENNRDLKNYDEEQFCVEGIKQEIDNQCNTIDSHVLNIVCKVLNEDGSWKNLAEIWNCDNAIQNAEVTSNPARYIFEFGEKIHGTMDLETLKELLRAINQTKALAIFE